MPYKDPQQPASIKDRSSLRDLTTRLLAKEYLDATESSLELRAYALENILPPLTVAIENLSVEVHKRGMMVAPAAEKAIGADDDPSFDPLNWLGKYVQPTI